MQGELQNVTGIQASGGAFAALRLDKTVITWGHPDCGGDSSAVQGQLHDVHQIQAAGDAFAAIVKEGKVVTWGDPDARRRTHSDGRLRSVG